VSYSSSQDSFRIFANKLLRKAELFSFRYGQTSGLTAFLENCYLSSLRGYSVSLFLSRRMFRETLYITDPKMF